MVIGIILVVHDEVKGPILRNSYLKMPLDIPEEFISKLFMNHAAFNGSSCLELKLNSYKVVSYFSGEKARIEKKEGILGLIMEADEETENLEPFLARNFRWAIKELKDNVLKEILLVKYTQYNALMGLLNSISLENIQNIYILKGNGSFQTPLIQLGENRLSILDLATTYSQMLNSQHIQLVHYVRLSIMGDHIFFLFLKMKRHMPKIDAILDVLKTYIEKNIDYALEMIGLSMTPHLVKVIVSNEFEPNQKVKNKKVKGENMLESLQQSKNYKEKYDNYVKMIVKNEGLLVPF